MAAEEKAESAVAESPKPKMSLQTLLVLGNAVLMLAVLGLVAYTKLGYQRPVITEPEELAKKQEEIKAAPEPTERPLVSFDQLSVNIAMTSGKQHYATVAFSVECRDDKAAAAITEKKAEITDKVIAILGKRQMMELRSIQGRLLFKSELLRAFNQIVEAGAATDLYFSAFILQ